MKSRDEKMEPPHLVDVDKHYLILNVSGVCYSIHRDVIIRQPSGLLVDLWKRLRHNKQKRELPKTIFRDKKPNTYLVQRSPEYFDIIFQYYITGKLHIPSWVCRSTIIDEVQFWRLDPITLCSCCFDATREEPKPEKKIRTLNRWQRMKMSMWNFFQHPRSSWGAMLYAIVSMVFVVISIINLIVSSIPSLQLCPPNGTEVYSKDRLDKWKEVLATPLSEFNETITAPANVTIDFKPGGLLAFFSNCWGLQKFQIVDMLCMTWFTLELAMRFWVCPSKRKFIKSPLNWADFLACFPFYVQILLWFFDVDMYKLPYNINMIFSFLKAVTTFRIFKLARYSEGLSALGKTLMKAKTELGMLCLFVSVSLLIFSSLVFELEKGGPSSQFTSIPMSMWWAVVTLATVGYGDIVPQTVPGQLVASVACVIGIMLVAMPVSVLADNFLESYKMKQLYVASDFYDVEK